MLKCLVTFLCLIAGVLGAPGRLFAEAMPPFRVFGYLPDYRIEKIDARVGKLVTDVIFYSIEPTPEGGLDQRRLTPETLRILNKIRDEGARIHLTLGGGNRSAGFSFLVANEKACDRFVQEVTDLTETHKFDGIDVNWEFPKTVAEHEGFSKLLRMLQQELEKRGRTLSIAVAPWQQLSAETIEAVDFVHLMAYDNSGEHSTLDYAIQQAARMQKRKVPAAKLNLGIPFYGRNVEHRRAVTYAEIVRRHQPQTEIDRVGEIYFNGPDTVQQKVQFARNEKLAGVMIWELGQDVPESLTLLQTVRQAAQVGECKTSGR